MIIDIVFVAVVVGLLIAIYKLKFQKAPVAPIFKPQQNNIGDEPEEKVAGWVRRSSDQQKQEAIDSDQQQGDNKVIDRRKQLRKEQKQRERQQRKEAMEQYLQNQRKKQQENQNEDQERERQQEEKKRKQEQYYRAMVEEQEKRKKAQYNKWKDLFQVEGSGNIKDSAEQQQRKKEEFLKNFQKTLKRNKLSLLEDLSYKFKLSTKEIIEKIKELEEKGRLSGICDQRGKYLYIEQEQWKGIQNYIQARGRVKKFDLISECSRIIKIPENLENEEFIGLIQEECK